MTNVFDDLSKPYDVIAHNEPIGKCPKCGRKSLFKNVEQHPIGKWESIHCTKCGFHENWNNF